MNKTKDIINKIVPFLKKNWFVFFALFVYVFFTFYYMGPSFTSCTTTVYGFGDNTAGPVRSSTLPDKQGLLGSYSSLTNAPFGDNTYNSVGYSLIGQTVLIKTLQVVAGPVCGYNLVNILGFVVSAMTMFGFVYFLTRKRWISLFAGYAASFSVYYQMKVGGHPSYGYQAIFIAIIWLFLRLIKFKRLRDAVFLGVAVGLSLYFDPYFTLFIALIILAMGLAWILYRRRDIFGWFRLTRLKRRSSLVTREFKLIAISVGIILLILMPLITVFASQSSNIEASVAASRGNVLAEAKACSNYPQEYLTPFILSPILEWVVGADRYHNAIETIRVGITCGIGEDSVSLSIILVLIFMVFCLIFFWERLNGRKLGMKKILSMDARLVFLVLVLVGLAGFLIALPPVRLHGIPTPSYILLSITSTWRTLTRGYMLVNISLVVICSIIMSYLWEHFYKHKKTLITLFILVCVTVFLEYQAFTPFQGNKLSTFDYVKDAPSAYLKLKSMSDVKIVAEYPLEQYGKESDAMSYYLSMQVIHGKKLFNSALSSSPYEQYKDGLKDLADPQTLSTLKMFGVDTVLLHGVTEAALKKAIPDVDIIFSESQARFNINSHSPIVGYDNVIAISLKNISAAVNYLDPGDGFARNTNIIKSSIDWNYEAISGSVMHTDYLDGTNIKTVTGKNKVCFSAKMSVVSEKTSLLINDGSGEFSVGEINGTSNQRYVFTAANGEYKIIAANGHNMRISELGCKGGEQ